MGGHQNMPHTRPEVGCYEIDFAAALPLDEAAEVALEDYARVLTRARAAEAVRAGNDPATVRGVHVCGLATTLTPTLLRDLEDFARSLIVAGPGGGLGWS
jgi:hypothetical protein